jgi:hypothetical protein
MASKKKEEATVRVSSFGIASTQIPIIGKTDLIPHAWDPIAIRIIVDAQQGKVREKTPRDPDAEVQACFYVGENEGDFIIPEKNIRACLIDACRLLPDLAMTTARSALRVNAPMLIEHEGWTTRGDPVRIGRGGTDIRFRPGFPIWGGVLDITYVGNVLSQEIVFNLVRAAGMCGILDWRPSKSNSGWAGTFDIDEERLVKA